MISLADIRKKLLLKHHSIGVLSCAAFSAVQELDSEQLKSELVKVHSHIPQNRSRENLLEAVKANQTTRYLKVWHDHGKISGHGHLLVLVASICYQAFFYTSQEMPQRGVNIDVPTIVEEPQLYLVARSGSSDAEQAMYNEERFLDLLTLQNKISTPDGIAIADVLRFFHGDSPAAQFECGQNCAGHYICTACTASVSKFDDILTCFRSNAVDLEDR